MGHDEIEDNLPQSDKYVRKVLGGEEGSSAKQENFSDDEQKFVDLIVQWLIAEKKNILKKSPNKNWILREGK